jgi:hypothetical protein
MAFNPLHTFQRNRRFWMAAILMICMISFVFCTGMKGDMAERIQWLLGVGGRGSSAFTLNGRSYSTKELHDLRMQRNLANKLLQSCSEMAFKKISKELYEADKKKDAKADKDAEARARRLVQLQAMRDSIAYRKAKPRYFEGGVKFDDLVEFATWQQLADRLSIQLDEEHVKFLYYGEFFFQLHEQEVSAAERDVIMRDFRDVSYTFVRKALSEEFRVRIAQEALIAAQPFQYLTRKEGFSLKFTNPEIPDEIRAPLTLSQLWDDYKRKRGEFEVIALPLEVERFIAQVKAEPTEDEKKAYFDANKDKAADPSSDVRGVQRPANLKIEYLLADATSPAYLNEAKIYQKLRVTGPWASDAVVSPLAALSSYWAASEMHRAELEAQYENMGRNEQVNYFTSPFSERDCTTPILAWLTRRHPEAGASLVGHAFLTQTDGLGAVAGALAWGAGKEHKDEIDNALRAELKRRAPVYAAVFAASTSGFPLEITGPFTMMDLQKTGHPMVPYLELPQRLPIEVVQREIEDVIARATARERAQQNMQVVRAALERADGSPEKFQVELNKYVKDMHLTYGPKDKNVYVNRFNVDEDKDLAPLKDAFLKNIDMINMFEGRDVTPERLLKPSDFSKMFFDSTEIFSASASYRAMPWPPKVKPNNARMWKHANPRLIDWQKIDPRAKMDFDQQLKQNDPLQQQPVFSGLFDTADKPILFWRTAERIPVRPTRYADIAQDLQGRADEIKQVEEQIKKQEKLTPEVEKLRKLIKDDPKNAEQYRAKLRPLRDDLDKLITDAGGNVVALRRKITELHEDQADLKEVQRLIVKGWKFDKARSSQVLPKAREIAETLIKNGNQGVNVEAAKLGASPFSLSRMCQMFPEEGPDGSVDYGKPTLPKDKLVFPRSDMIDITVGLYDLDKPIKLGNDEIYKTNPGIHELDKLNAELFEQRKKMDNAHGHYVQILTNKPRSVFYVVFVPTAPQAVMTGPRPRPFGKAEPSFTTSLTLAPLEARMGARDRWVERDQQQFAQAYRSRFVAGIKTSMGYSENEKEKASFDDRVTSD